MPLSAANLISNPSFANTMQPIVYVIKPGDTLGRVIFNYYGVPMNSPRYQTLLKLIMATNSGLENPNRIYAGKTLLLFPEDYGHRAGQCTIEDALNADKLMSQQTFYAPMLQRYQNNLPTGTNEQEAFWAMSWLQENYDFLSLTTGVGLTSLGNMTSEAHSAIIRQVDLDYKAYKQGQITQNQYNYRRQQSLALYKDKVGPLEKVLLKGKTAREAIRINRSRALPASANIDRHLAHLGKLSKVAANGGPLLTIAGGAMSCYNIAHANTTQEKNEIFVETIVGATTGTAASGALALFLISNPVGWVMGLTLAAGITAMSYGSGKLARYGYTKLGSQPDFVTSSIVGDVCR
ncbi:LysM peptidoglycan-binding domain-containing protein [Oceanobacter mangrovi]|uniref:LysM peptidoglycan-binding domain-containing protein n=1 Tax=Oceanobacter mangrovi TaxID=2862510 RepID=UPI001C8D0EAA|nr:LysM domain-containing protein [Oceanobacter mangrovi]